MSNEFINYNFKLIINYKLLATSYKLLATI